MTNAQIALEAASRVHQNVEGKMTARRDDVIDAANTYLRWLEEKDGKYAPPANPRGNW